MDAEHGEHADHGGQAGGTTSLTVTHYGAALGSPAYSPLDTFVMRKSLRDGRVQGHGRRLAAAS